MSEAPAEAAPAEASAEASSQGNPGEEAPLGDAGKQALDRMKAERNEATKRAKALEQELEKVRKSSMSEAEKAVAEAEARGRTSAAQEYGKRLATSEIRASAATAERDLAGVFDYIDLGRFVGEDGEPDAKAIEAFVAGLPKKDPGAPSFDGGSRTPPPAQQSMSGLIRKAAGRA